MDLNIIILAAGSGTRMKSKLPKVMHLLGNFPLIDHILLSANILKAQQTFVVLNKQASELISYLTDKKDKTLSLVYQEEQLGTAHAVLSAESAIYQKDSTVLIMYGDTPLISHSKLQELVSIIGNNKADVAVLAFENEVSNQYGKLKLKDNKIVEIIEEAENCNSKEMLTLCNSGVMAFNGKKIWSLLHKINNNNSKKEYYLTDIIALANNNSLVCDYVIDSESNLQGANSKTELAKLEQVFQEQKRKQFLEEGVQMIDPSSVYFSLDTKIAENTIIYPNVYCYPKVSIGNSSIIYPFSVLEGANIGENCSVGPFARLRPNTNLAEHTKIGNFVEVKQSNIKEGAKINHLSYIGNSEIGTNTNIGAGTITCNYDGNKKHQTTIGENSFIGSNTALVAPINIGKEVTIGAGSTITKNVPANTLAIARCFQKHIPKSRLNTVKEDAE